METTKFKTNIKCDGCISKVTPSLNETVGEGQWHVDLTDAAKTLSVPGNVDEQKIKEALLKVGYKAEKV
ncbi:MAG TPA: heavy-metal-associated domain-containing protein [Ohtaekwangia sp.]|nr:heavy-metal-associated domain-containing protein [Ohtaekwangia sp.]